MEYLITCSCGKEVTISKSQAGQEVQCDCGESVQVPTLRNFADLKTVESETTQEKAELRTEKRNAWKGWRGPTMAFFALIFVAASLWSAYHYFDSYRWDTQYTTEDYIAEQNAYLDIDGPDELALLWGEFRQGTLRQRVPPEFHLMNQMAAEQSFVGKVGAIVAAVALVAMLGIWSTTLGSKE